jgi:predicted metal-dependent HD superfamily phosphohydrolase
MMQTQSNHRSSDTELQALWRALAAARQWPDATADAPVIGGALLQRYAEPHRAYHTGQHILALLHHATAADSSLDDPHAVAFAIWFHDAIYDPMRHDNEVQSAALARETLTKLGDTAIIPAVEAMILATIKHQLPENASNDLKLFLDFDLSILGTPPETYAAYSAAIRSEYSFVPEENYRLGRRAILENFLQRDALYFTDYGHQKWETQARLNLAAEIATLS